MSNIERNRPISIVIFGASGDLAHRKLIPALLNLCRKQRLPTQFEIIGFAINAWDDPEFRTSLLEGVTRFADYPFTHDQWLDFSAHLHYLKGSFTEPADFLRLGDLLKSLENGPTDRLYYMATPPQFFGPIVQQLGKAGLTEQQDGWRRVVVEKPFGNDLQTARELNTTLHQVIKEEQIYRIDHYLGKETVQNLLVFRFANTIFEPVWNNQYIDHVQISVLEEVSVGHRAGYYDKAGTLRDMFQNHLMQLLVLIAIEPPSTLKHKDLHERKLEVLRAVQPLNGQAVAENTVRGQYEGYCQEEGVGENSQTETYAALRLQIDNERWKGVPFFLRSGKALDRKCTEIIIQFKCTPTAVEPLPVSEEITPDILAFCIQPDEGIYLRFDAKVPDTEADVRPVEMEFHYSSTFGPSSIPEAYERLILEVIQGDHTLFIQDETAELSWALIDPIIEYWKTQAAPPLETYPKNTWGPDTADRLIRAAGWEWLVTCGQHHDGECADDDEQTATGLPGLSGNS